jgi:thiamine-phosphate pyrophosphorylase
LTAQLKHLRHRLASLLAQFPTADLLASRETLADVGTQLSTPSEQTRADLSDVVTANCKRLQESLRSLEEYCKTIDAALAVQLEQLRYHAYTLERAVAITSDSLQRLAHARLYVLIDGRESPSAFAELASSLIAAGVHVLQLRDKRLADRELLDRARQLRELTRSTGFQPVSGSQAESLCYGPLFIMNDRPDLAALSQADGVHLGQEELTVKDARAIVGPRALIGVSTHSIEQARQAVLEGASYIGVGPTFPSGTKRFDAFPGLDLLRAVSAEIRLPAFAIGGITRDNLPEVLAAGIPRVAVSGAICGSLNPADAAREFLLRLSGG